MLYFVQCVDFLSVLFRTNLSVYLMVQVETFLHAASLVRIINSAPQKIVLFSYWSTQIFQNLVRTLKARASIQ